MHLIQFAGRRRRHVEYQSLFDYQLLLGRVSQLGMPRVLAVISAQSLRSKGFELGWLNYLPSALELLLRNLI